MVFCNPTINACSKSLLLPSITTGINVLLFFIKFSFINPYNRLLLFFIYSKTRLNDILSLLYKIANIIRIKCDLPFPYAPTNIFDLLVSLLAVAKSS